MARKIVDNHRTRMPRPPITDHSGADPRRSPLAPSDPSLADPRPPPRHGQFIHQHVQRDACTSSRGRAASLTYTIQLHLQWLFTGRAGATFFNL